MKEVHIKMEEGLEEINRRIATHFKLLELAQKIDKAEIGPVRKFSYLKELLITRVRLVIDQWKILMQRRIILWMVRGYFERSSH